jgi:hypothetical protein
VAQSRGGRGYTGRRPWLFDHQSPARLSWQGLVPSHKATSILGAKGWDRARLFREKAFLAFFQAAGKKQQPLDRLSNKKRVLLGESGTEKLPRYHGTSVWA